MNFDGVTKIYRIMLDEPADISADVWYTIAISTNLNTFKGSGGIQFMTCGTVNIEFRNSGGHTNANCISYGQVPEIIFSNI